MKKLTALLLAVLLPVLCLAGCTGAPSEQVNEPPAEESPQEEDYLYFMDLDGLLIRDPHVYVDRAEGLYYMTGANHGSSFSSDALGIYYYVSRDLESWAGPFELLSNDDMKTKSSAFWAPEVHRIDGEFYLFLTVQDAGPNGNGIGADGRENPRRTDIFKSTSGLYAGPYEYHGCATLEAPEFCIDATYYEEDGVRWSVYCREWIALPGQDGEIRAVCLKDDLTGIEAETDRLLFKASDKNSDSGGILVTDGPYMHRGRYGELFMLWTTFYDENYTLCYARSDNGRMDGNWIQGERALYTADGGHGMVFYDLQGKLRITFHTPNINNSERIVIYELDDTVMNTLTLKS